MEVRVISCKECGEDFCDGSMCSMLTYENFFRPQANTSGRSKNLLTTSPVQKKRKKKKRKRKRRCIKKAGAKGSRRKLGKNSIFNRPTSRGCTRDHSRYDSHYPGSFEFI